tara:strand:- start:109 stop:387 length:279 start_codon:yes stop_codon:yes gene_type:complete
MKPFKITYDTDRTALIPVDGLVKVLPAFGSNNVVLTYAGTETITLGITLADAAAEKVVQGNIMAVLEQSYNEGVQATGFIVYPYTDSFSSLA